MPSRKTRISSQKMTAGAKISPEENDGKGMSRPPSHSSDEVLIVDSSSEGEELTESAAFGKGKAPDFDECNENSNMASIMPAVNMAIDFRDSDFIWSPAKIVKVFMKRDKQMVCIRYEGWPSEWDEECSWPNAKIARLHTYTKRVKCFADGIISKQAFKLGTDKRLPVQKRKQFKFWPCLVSFRMPHPTHRVRAEELLRLEPNCFVQPYGVAEGLLPPEKVGRAIANGGCWLHVRKLRLWKSVDNARIVGDLPENFTSAHKLGRDDVLNPGFLPKGAMDMGSLLHEKYRVLKLSTATFDGESFTGEIKKPAKSEEPSPPPDVKQSSVTVVVDADGDVEVPTAATAERFSERLKPNDEPEKHVVEPPCLPKPVVIVNPPSQTSAAAVPSQEANRWNATVAMGGNDLLLGSYPSRAHALASSKIALATGPHQRNVLFPQSAREGRIADLSSIRLEDSICALEQTWDPANNFSMQNWAAQNDRYLGYKKQQKQAGTGNDTAEKPNTIGDRNTDPKSAKRKRSEHRGANRTKRKQSNPVRVERKGSQPKFKGVLV